MYFKHEIARDVGQREPTLEPFILKSPRNSYFYSKQVLKKRWRRAESVILKDPKYAYLYSKNVLRRRWKRAEDALKELVANSIDLPVFKFQALDAVVLYAVHVVKGRWKEAEHLIAQSPDLGAYINRLNEEEFVGFKKMITLCAMEGNPVAKKFFSWQPTHTVKMEGMRAFDIMLDSERRNRWSHVDETFIRAFKLEEWLESSIHTPECLTEFSEKHNKWYWKRWSKDGTKEYLVGTVTPILEKEVANG